MSDEFEGDGGGRGWLETRAAIQADVGTEAAGLGHETYRLLFDHATDPIFCIDADTMCMIALNKTACAVLGYAHHEIIGRHVRFIDTYVDEESIRRYTNQIDADGKGVLVTRHRRRDGTEIPVEVLSRVRDWNGRKVYDCIARDLRERQAVDEARRTADLAFQSAGRVAMVGAWTLDLHTGETFLSDEVCRIYGLPEGTNFPAEEGILHYPEDVRPALTRAVEAAIGSGTAYDMVIPFLTKQGKRRWVRTIGQPEFDASGTPVRLFGAFQDVTHQRTAELLRQVQSTLRLVGSDLRAEDDIAPVLAAFCDAMDELRIPAARCAWCVAGISGPLVADRRRRPEGGWFDAEPPAPDATDLHARIVPSGATREPDTFDSGPSWLRVGAGSVALLLELSSGATVEPTEEAAVRQLAREVADANVRLNERKLARAREEQLQQAQKLESIGRLAGGVAHDFNNLLSVILTTCHLLTFPEGTEDSEHVDIIEAAALRARDLTQQLLAFSRKQVLRPQVVPANQAVSEIGRLLTRLLGTSTTLVLRTEAQRDAVFVDRGQFDQIIMNLTVNARDAMPNGGRIEIATGDVVWTATSPDRPANLGAGRYVRVTVEDTGDGIPDHVLPHIFDPFFTTKPPGKGTGLGLAMVHGTVTQSGGHIRVRRPARGGTAFDIHLPCAESAGEPREPDAGASDRQSARILVVDDDDALRPILRQILQRSGFEVIDVEGYEELQRRLADGLKDVDALLTDVVLGGLSGQSVVVAARDSLGPIPVVFMSGYADRQLLDAVLAVPNSAFLPKPFNLPELVAVIRAALERGKGRPAP